MDIAFAFPMSQAHWWALIAAVSLGLVVFALRRAERLREQRIERFAESRLASRLAIGYDPRARKPLFWLTFLGFFFLALTFAQPHWGQKWQDIRKVSRDIIVCIDTSESMRAENPLPSRLDLAKRKVVSLMDQMPGDRFALVAFSGAAALQCPLTLDHGYFKAVLKAVDTDTISEKGTNIAAALREAVNTFKEDEVRSKSASRASRAILLISDGEQTQGDVIEEAEEAAAYATLYVMGIGDPNGAIVKLPEWLARQGRGAETTRLSKLDEDTLIRIATTGAGQYVRAEIDNWDIEQIHTHMQDLAARVVESDVRLRMVNRYQWPLLLAILCFMGEGLWLTLLPGLRRWKERRQTANAGENVYA